jgi:hypothetical protein
MAKHIAGELVKHQDKRKTAIGVIGPMVKPSSKRVSDGFAKSVLDGSVKIIIFCEPKFGCCFDKPEI